MSTLGQFAVALLWAAMRCHAVAAVPDPKLDSVADVLVIAAGGDSAASPERRQLGDGEH
jgi:hypothetical protein